MSVSGSRATDEINLDEFERRLRAAGGQQASAEDPLAELSRLVEFSHFGISNGGTPAAPRRRARRCARGRLRRSIENEALRPTIDDEVEELAPGASEADREARQDYEFHPDRSDDAYAAEPAEERRPMRWKLEVSALALAGVAMIGAVFALKGGVPGLPKQPPFIAAAQGPTKVEPPSDETVTASSDAGRFSPQGQRKAGSGQSRQFRGAAGRFERAGSLGNPPSAARQSARSRGSGQAAGSASGATPLAATANTPLVAPPGAAAAGHELGIPRAETGAHGFVAAGRNPDRRVNPPDQPASDAKPAGSPPPEAPAKPGAEDDERCGRRRAAFDAQT